MRGSNENYAKNDGGQERSKACGGARACGEIFHYAKEEDEYNRNEEESRSGTRLLLELQCGDALCR